MTFQVPMTRREAVVQRLREEIVAGELAPGTVLKDGELAARLGVSVTPVREAITQLAAEGLIDISPNRARTVAALNQKTILELIDLMELLACAGFEWGVENLTENHVVRLRKRYAEFTDGLRNDDMAAAAAAGSDFSTIIVMAAGNVELQSMLDVVVTRCLRRLALSTDSELWTPWVDGYAQVLDRLEAGDQTGAALRYRQIYTEYRRAAEHFFWPAEPR
jgi:DNA-binding GntR family transcriptional regulator